MNNFPIYQSRFDALKCCVVIPTYNNDKTVGEVISDLLTYTNNILVVNDGSTDGTAAVLSKFPKVQVHTFPANRGKGAALKSGFLLAESSGYDYAITIDSDGQHYPKDLDIFLSELENKKPEDPEILLVGDRKMGQDGIPAKSSTGNKFSSFWFLVVTGINLKDTQSGYRLYPLKIVNSFNLFTRKFEYEIEILVRAAWKRIEVKNIPIQVLYPENRVTHFRPFWDITRIVLLYMWFVLASFFYVHPRNKIQDFKEKGFKRFWKEDVLKSEDPAHKKAAAIALGVFVGISPFWGLHTLLVFLLAAFFKLNKVIAFLFSNISIPPLIPFIIYASYQAGSVLTGKGIDWDLQFSDFDSTAEIMTGLFQYVIGSFALAALVASILGIGFYSFFSAAKRKPLINS